MSRLSYFLVPLIVCGAFCIAHAQTTTVIQDHGPHTNGFALARSLCGDGGALNARGTDSFAKLASRRTLRYFVRE
jgi:hypothetical protein